MKSGQKIRVTGSRKAKNYALADEIEMNLKLRIILEDTSAGSVEAVVNS